jgi:hypothetical protein
MRCNAKPSTGEGGADRRRHPQFTSSPFHRISLREAVIFVLLAVVSCPS